MWQRLLAVIVALVAAAALLSLDVVLLESGSASSDPVGTVSVRMNSAATSIPVSFPVAHAWTVRPTTGHVHDDSEDD